MIKCPNCGSTAQPKVILDKHYAHRNGSERVVVYNCGCGVYFFTSQLYMFDKPITAVREGGIINATVEEILQYWSRLWVRHHRHHLHYLHDMRYGCYIGSRYDHSILHRLGNRYGFLLAGSAAQPCVAQCCTVRNEHLLSYQFDLGVNMKIQAKVIANEKEKEKLVALARQLEDINFCELASCECEVCLQEACPFSKITSQLWKIANNIITIVGE